MVPVLGFLLDDLPVQPATASPSSAAEIVLVGAAVAVQTVPVGVVSGTLPGVTVARSNRAACSEMGLAMANAGSNNWM